MNHLPEVVQAVTAFVGVATAAISAVVARSRIRATRELKKIDVSAEWQAQMLARIIAVEAELQKERARGDELEQDGFNWRKQTVELGWELRQSRVERQALTLRVDALDVENTALKQRNAALSSELRDLRNQIRSGHDTLSLAPPPFPKKPKLKP